MSFGKIESYKKAAKYLLDKRGVIMDEKEKLKNQLFEQLSISPDFRNLAMDRQGEMVNNFIDVVLLLREPFKLMKEE